METSATRAKELNNALLDPKLKVFADEVMAAYKYESSRIAKLLETGGPLTEVEVQMLNYHKAQRSCYAHILNIKRTLEDELSTFLEETSSETADVKESVE